MDFFYVYHLRSEPEADRHYTGTDLAERLRAHSGGGVMHTRKFRPWRIEVVVAFRDERKARAFEKYLKTSSGRTFSKRHF